jgi:hypothetical protein
MANTQDLIITNARILTMDPQNPTAEAVVTKGNKIAFVGSDSEVEAWKTDNSRVIDGKGRTLMPGIIDSHFHILSGSLSLGSAPLIDVLTLDDLKESLQSYARDHPEYKWVTGTRIGYDILPDGQRLNRHHLDEIIPDQPVILISYDFHTGWANTRALELAGLLHGADLGLSGEIVMGEDGLANGELREGHAYEPVLSLSEIYSGLRGYAGTPKDPFNLAQVPPHVRNLLREGMEQASRLGITSIHNMMGDPGQLALLSAMEAEGELPLRIYFPYTIFPDGPPEAVSEAIAMRDGHQGNLVRCGSAKLFIDGVIESWTALMLEDYANKPGFRGESLWDFEDFTSRVTELDQAGFQVIVHAIGDGAIRRTFDAYEAAISENGARDSRHRIEHIELLHPDDLPRFAELEVIASMQPLHAPSKEIWPAIVWPECVPQSRWGDAFPWQDIRDTGVPLVFGSDWAVASQDPWWGLQTALTRQSMAPGLPDQRQTLDDALASYTRDAAYAEFQEGVKGQLKVGMLADLILLSADLEATAIEEIRDVRPTLTVCDGVITYEV